MRIKNNINCLLFSLIFIQSNVSLAEDHDTLKEAINSIWQGQSLYVNKLYKFESNKKLSYQVDNLESSHFTFNNIKLDSSKSLFGAIPSMNIDSIYGSEVWTPKRQYTVIRGTGSGLFSVGEWSDLSFIHVIETTNQWRPKIYSLPATSATSEILLGKYKDSNLINYLRVIPVHMTEGQFIEYEVSIYALDNNKIEPVKENNKHIAYKVNLKENKWHIEHIDSAVYTKKIDLAQRPYYLPIEF